MQTQTSGDNAGLLELLEQFSNEFGKRVARVIVAKTMAQLFSGTQQLSHEISDPMALLEGRAPASAGRTETGRRMRRSTESLDKSVDSILAALRAAPDNRMSAQDLRKATGLDKPGLLLPLKRAIATGAVNTAGQRRGMVYILGGAKHDKEDKIPAKDFVAKGVIRRKRK